LREVDAEVGVEACGDGSSGRLNLIYDRYQKKKSTIERPVKKNDL
jgi:hypothetical protein